MTLQSFFTYALTAFWKRTIRETYPKDSASGIPLGLFDQAAEEFAATLPDNIRWNLNGRFERGLEIAKAGKVSAWPGGPQPDNHRCSKVLSSNPTRPPYHYKVDLDAETCECPDFYKGHYCKHLIAAHIRYEAFRLTVTLTLENKKPKETELPVQPPKQTETNNNELPSTKGDYIIWAVVKHNGTHLGVEVLNIEADTVSVRALPIVTEDKKLRPQFPFEGKRCTATFPKKSIYHVKVFR